IGLTTRAVPRHAPDTSIVSPEPTGAAAAAPPDSKSRGRDNAPEPADRQPEPEAPPTAEQPAHGSSPSEERSPASGLTAAEDTDSATASVPSETTPPAPQSAGPFGPPEPAAAQGGTGAAAGIEVVLGRDSGGSPVAWQVSTKGSPHAFIIGIP